MRKVHFVKVNRFLFTKSSAITFLCTHTHTQYQYHHHTHAHTHIATARAHKTPVFWLFKIQNTLPRQMIVVSSREEAHCM